MENIVTVEIIENRSSMNNEETKLEDSKKVIMLGHDDDVKWFNESCAGWTKDPEYNLMFLRQVERYANDLLRARGYLFLNEVHDMLDIPKTKAGQIVGWIYDENNPVGDNYVDFGLLDECNSEFINGTTQNAMLNFNVDGCIINRI